MVSHITPEDTGHTIMLSADYLNREAQRGYMVLDWLKKYCKKNKVGLSVVHLSKDKYLRNPETYYQIVFKSQRQFDAFLRQGSKAFPYFEFI